MKKVTLILIIIIILGSMFLCLYFRADEKIYTREIRAAEKIIGLKFTQKERKMMQDDLRRNLSRYQELRKLELKNYIPPALLFFPITAGKPIPRESISLKPDEDASIEIPKNLEDIAYYPVTSLAQLIKQKKISSLELTQLYLIRLKRYSKHLECVVTLTEDLALKQARQADQEISAGKYRGPLHGIPWGAKDLLATKGIKTSWGAMPYKDQILDINATVVKRLEDAGAVLVAKLTMGALAMGDVWFGGKTKNPWNLEQGSSGSSAGSASATAAGLVGFSIGTETLGSIVSPSTRCGVTGLRPTFGRISRYGAMALSWSMDKIGPICRSAEDCALVLNAICGPDGKDLTVLDHPFNWDPCLDLKSIRVGYLKEDFEKGYRNKANDSASLEVFKSLGVELIPINLPDTPADAIRFILTAEAAAAFDDLTRTGKDDLLVRQDKNAWPNSFRQARFIPAVEYIRANRIRVILMQEMAGVMQEVDVYVAPSFGSSNLLITNLTGHPTVVVPNGFNQRGSPTSISFTGKLFQEAKTLRVAKAYQDATDFHLQHPDLEKNIQALKKETKTSSR